MAWVGASNGVSSRTSRSLAYIAVIRAVSPCPVKAASSPHPLRRLGAQGHLTSILESQLWGWGPDCACPSSGCGSCYYGLGQSWVGLSFPCGQNGRRTVDFRSGEGLAIVGQRIRVGDPISGTYSWIDSPVAAPTALTALGNTIIVFGPASMAISEDAGHSFDLLQPPAGLLEVKDAALDPKGLLAVVGRAGAGNSPVMVSLDGGRSWRNDPRPSSHYAIGLRDRC